MRFYTNVQMVGDHFLVRGYEDGRHFMTREKFKKYDSVYIANVFYCVTITHCKR